MITIFTPTYNRAHLLPCLYNSLKNQTVCDFEWLIVDDGSVDNTKKIVESWIDENIIKIRYIYQENGGKHVAFNNGVRNAMGELLFCIDSDDYAPSDCVEVIIDCWSNVKNSRVAGIVALKADADGNFLSSVFPENVEETTIFDLASKYKCGGEKAIIYKTSILKENSYPEIEGEKFVTECVVYDNIDRDYVMILLNKVLTIVEYQPDGLTANIFSIMLKNPTGYKIFYKQRIDMAYTLLERIGYIIRYNAFDILCKDKKYNYNGKYKFLVLILKPLGWLLTKYYNYKRLLTSKKKVDKK